MPFLKNKKTLLFSLILTLTLSLFCAFYYLQNQEPKTPQNEFALEAVAPELSPFSEYYRAKVIKIIHEETEQYGNSQPSIIQTVLIQILTGTEKDKEIEINNKDALGVTEAQKLRLNDQIVIGKIQNSPGENEPPQYVILDKYRLPSIGIIISIFFGLAIVFGKIRGLTASIGLMFSIFLLVYFIAPNIIAGKDPILVSLIGSCLIVAVSIFFSHGFNESSALSTISTYITLGLATTMAVYFVNITKLFGLGSSDAAYLQTGLAGSINLKGLLLGGIIIGTLGILDDVTTTQTATIKELITTDPKLTFRELYTKGIRVGKEHIASLVNTLVLAYAGASLPLFLLFTITTNQPTWTVINSEFIAEEIVRTLLGSSALIIAVPISTMIAAYYYSQKTTTK
jgi:uncharacterized membrane protein